MQLPGSFFSAPIKRAQPAERAGMARVSMQAVPPPILVLLSMTSAQIGAALAKGLFQSIGPTGAVFLRCAIVCLSSATRAR